MRYLLFLGVVSIPSGLLYAYLDSGRNWTRGLYISAGGIAFLVALFVSFGMQRARDKKDWQAPTAGILGVLGVVSRLAQMKWYHDPKQGPHLVALSEVGLISFYWVSGALALLLGAYGVLMALTSPETLELSKKQQRYDLVCGSAGIAAALYCFASVSQHLGIGINHWTFLGIMGLSGVSFLFAMGMQRLTKPKIKNEKKKG